MILPYGTRVRSVASSERGTIVGYGTITWPNSPNVGGDGGQPVAVYLVQLDGCEGSGYGRSAAAIFRVDRTEDAS